MESMRRTFAAVFSVTTTVEPFSSRVQWYLMNLGPAMLRPHSAFLEERAQPLRSLSETPFAMT